MPTQSSDLSHVISSRLENPENYRYMLTYIFQQSRAVMFGMEKIELGRTLTIGIKAEIVALTLGKGRASGDLLTKIGNRPSSIARDVEFSPSGSPAGNIFQEEYNKGWPMGCDFLVSDGDQGPLLRTVEAARYMIFDESHQPDTVLVFSDEQTKVKITLEIQEKKRTMTLQNVFDNRYSYSRKVPRDLTDSRDYVLWFLDDTAYTKKALFEAPLAPDPVDLLALLIHQSSKSKKEVAEELGIAVQTLNRFLSRKQIPGSSRVLEAIEKFSCGSIPRHARW